MKIKIIVLAALAFCVISACSKDTFTSKPQLTFKSVNTTTLLSGGIIVFGLDYTDKDGDIAGSDSILVTDTTAGAIFYQKVTSNCSLSDASGWYRIPPDFVGTSNSKGTIDVTFGYGINTGAVPINQPACQGQNDTCVFRFLLKDRAGNRSDTVTSPQIVIVKP